MTTKVDHRRILGRLDLLRELEPTEIDAIATVTHAKTYAPRIHVVRQGEPADAAYVVVHGRLKVTALARDGHDAALSVMGPGEIFGELAILDGGTRSATVRAIEPTLLLVIERAAFERMLRARPAVAVKVLRVLARRLRRLTERIESAEGQSIPARLASTLASLASEHGKIIAGGTLIDIDLSQRELGELIGATRESVNKTLASFVRRGLLAKSGKHLVVTDAAALRRSID